MELCIINYGSVGGYAKVSERMDKSLTSVGFKGSRIIHKGDLPEGSPLHSENPYAFKIYCFEEALKAGHRKIIWLDSSIYAVKPLEPLYEYIATHGYHLFRTGYNLAQSVNDRTLEYAGITRDEAENITEYASGMVALDFDREICRNVYHDWKEMMHQGYFKGSRTHDNQSQDPRFLFHRQDQSCLSIAMHKNGMKMGEETDFIAYWGDNYNHDKLIFYIKGI